jgi:hypothetical protein
VSAAVEACQLFLPARVSSPVDVASNGFGAFLGAAAAAYLRAGERPAPAPALFAFEMPLMNVVYLLIPLLWLGSLSMGGEVHRLLLLPVLGVFGGSVLASVYVNRMGPDREQGGLMPAVYALGWFGVGMLPAITVFPLEVSALAIVVGAAAQLSAWLWKRWGEVGASFRTADLEESISAFRPLPAAALRLADHPADFGMVRRG